MSRESKVLIFVGGLAALGLVLALGGNMALGLLVLAIGLVAGFVGLRLTAPDTTDPFEDARAEADQTATGTLTPNEPLTAWAPEGGLNAWTPPVELVPLAPTEPASDPYVELAPEPQPEPTSWNDTSWDSTVTWEADAPTAPAPAEPRWDAEPAAPAPPAWDPAPAAPTWEPEPAAPTWEPEPVAPTWEAPPPVAPAAEPAPSMFSAPPPAPVAPVGRDTNPLDDLVGLEALDPIAEVERIESREAANDGYSGFTPFDATPINENVTGADDIMAASQATELNLGGGEQTELQKLLAKVQIRLSAYE